MKNTENANRKFRLNTLEMDYASLGIWKVIYPAPDPANKLYSKEPFWDDVISSF